MELTEADEFIVISSRALWKYISPQDAVDCIRTTHNPQIAAKMLQVRKDFRPLQLLEYFDLFTIIYKN